MKMRDRYREREEERIKKCVRERERVERG